MHEPLQDTPKDHPSIFDRNVVEFVTVAAEYCAFLERSADSPRASFASTALKLLPLLYLKATLLPRLVRVDDEAYLEHFVGEEDYEALRQSVAAVMGDRDDYLDVFVSDMKYSDTPIRKTISEDLADIWQDVKNFVCLFQSGMHDTMNDALVECADNFVHYWGQTLVNTLRALHEVCYGENDDNEDFE